MAVLLGCEEKPPPCPLPLPFHLIVSTLMFPLSLQHLVVRPVPVLEKNVITTLQKKKNDLQKRRREDLPLFGFSFLSFFFEAERSKEKKSSTFFYLSFRSCRRESEQESSALSLSLSPAPCSLR